MKVGFLITARLKSTRLPRKVLLEVCDKTFLHHLIDRVKQIPAVNEIIVCTSTHSQDDPLEQAAQRLGVQCFRGDEDDVLLRLHETAQFYQLDYILNITADCPLIDPIYAQRVVEFYKKTDADLITALDLPHGMFVYGIKPAALSKVIIIKEDKYTEVWGKYFTDIDLFKVEKLPVESAHRRFELRLTLDYPDDYTFFKRLYSDLFYQNKLTIGEIIEHLDRNRDIPAITQNCHDHFKKKWLSESKIYLKARYEVKKAAIFGCGSIGKRHIKNLMELGITDVIAYRTKQGYSKELSAEFNIKQTSDWQEIDNFKPDIAFVTNPTSLHYATIKKLIGKVKGIFIEKPLSHTLVGIDELLKDIKQAGMVTFHDYNLRFHPIVKKIEEVLKSGSLGDPINMQATVGRWLPDWHPYETYTASYAARSDIDIGALLTLSHEIDLVMHWFGSVDKLVPFSPTSPLLDLDVDVKSDLMLHHKSNTVSQLHLDFIQKPFHREGIINLQRGWLSYDFAQGHLTMQQEGKTEKEILWCDNHFDMNTTYLEMVQKFIQYVQEGRIHHEYDTWQGMEGLRTIERCVQSAKNPILNEVNYAE